MEVIGKKEIQTTKLKKTSKVVKSQKKYYDTRKKDILKNKTKEHFWISTILILLGNLIILSNASHIYSIVKIYSNLIKE